MKNDSNRYLKIMIYFIKNKIFKKEKLRKKEKLIVGYLFILRG